MKQPNILVKTILVLSISLTLIACSKVTQANFDKIKSNMSMNEVIAILGNPTTSEDLAIGDLSGTSATWKDNKAEIDIQFLNDRVTVKSFNKTIEGSE